MRDKAEICRDLRELKLGPLRLELRREGDRFAQYITVGGSPMLSSIEGNESEVWPPSPPLQQLMSQATARGQALLAIGSSGTTHWSQSVEADTNRNELIWELAARVNAPSNLANTFRLATGVCIHDHCGGGRLKLQFPEIAGLVSIIPDDLTTRLDYYPERKEVLLQPLKNSPQMPNTIRWKFTLRIE